VEKRVKNGQVEAKQLLMTPYGKDPIILSQTEIINNSEQVKPPLLDGSVHP